MKWKKGPRSEKRGGGQKKKRGTKKRGKKCGKNKSGTKNEVEKGPRSEKRGVPWENFLRVHRCSLDHREPRTKVHSGKKRSQIRKTGGSKKKWDKKKWDKKVEKKSGKKK